MDAELLRSPEFSFVNTINRRRQFHFIFKLACSRVKYRRFHLENEKVCVFDRNLVEDFISILFTENLLWAFACSKSAVETQEERR